MKKPVFRRDGNATIVEKPIRGSVATSDGAELLKEAEGLELAQQTALEAAPIEQAYQEELAFYTQSKSAQVEHIEDRLEHLIDRQQARLQQSQAGKPGLLSRPGARQEWQSQQARQQARLQVLHTRLEFVREIKEGMGLHGPKVEELATRKMRAENPELASSWDAMQEAQRRHQAHIKKQEQEKKQTQEQRLGRSHSLGLSRIV